MNIFYFDECPVVSAEAQPDKMLVKMPLETAQMLCTAHRVLDGDEYADANGLYKTAYKNHPCTVWARQSRGNYEWLYVHFLALAMEYNFRYNSQHGHRSPGLHSSGRPDPHHLRPLRWWRLVCVDSKRLRAAFPLRGWRRACGVNARKPQREP